MSDPVLEFEDASFSFGEVTILDDASLALDGGTFVALVGANGSGKTTALELLAGLRPLDAGTVTRPTTAGRTVAYLPQSPRFRPGFTVREVVEFYGSLVEGEVDTDAILARVGLGGAADRRVDELSGGMARLLGLAQALIGDPPVVVLDEPTSGLDPDIADHIFEAAAAMAADDRLVLTTSHDLEAVSRYADRVVLIANGEFVLDGSPAALLEQAGEERLRDVFSAAVAGRGREAVDIDAPTDGGGK
ncbi:MULTISPECIES: ABC transporter ATP-binding protein [Halolamina]|uniref:ABC-type multidrug transport system, ATPase component n=1 Tax=Halolamina pelagica TaxID=699431 RepID=A0A1I5PW68_9EURY|nr:MULTISPECIES: ABC transporter ATP-binding protein [Halolamina]NHX34976.1 ABC transporter ATP-binding protein [Halolamina sp. R1-12]SFP38252.1 ABC-type multidrug transport system, ATPase component [Halolamina pelagica]